MKKRFTALFLALALCLGLAVPAFAADDTAAQAHAAMAAYQGVMSSPPRLNSYTEFKYVGGFYLDFNQDGVPELVLVYDDGGYTEWAMIVYYYDGMARRITTGYPCAAVKNYSEKILFSTLGGSGGSAGQIVRFSDGTYGLQQYAFGFATTTLTAKFSGNALTSAGNNGTAVYTPHFDKLPSLTQFYTPPAKPTDGSADFGLYWYDTIMVDYFGPGGRVTVPSTVTEIREPNTPEAYNSITALTLPSGIKEIGDLAFLDCSKLTSVNLPSGLKRLGEMAFSGAGLTSVTIPSSVTEIGDGAFSACALTSVTFQPGLEYLGPSMFYGCDKLTSATIPASVEYIGSWAFACCRSLTKLVIENGNTEIGEYAFVNKDATNTDIVGNIPVTIHSQPGGAVERYCKANGIPFQPLGSGTTSQFTDVAAGTWYAPPVDWAVSKGITNGTEKGKFSPTQTCTHAQILTFLYRANRGGGAADPADMDKAVAWAREKGMIGSGFNGGKFCTRADAVNYIWQAFGRQSAKASSFTDVPANASYARAVDWAVASGVTNGTNTAQTEFSPSKVCDRGTIVTFLHRAFVEEARVK